MTAGNPLSVSDLPLIFSLLWPQPDSLSSSLGEEDWQELDRLARQHRLIPLLHARSREFGWQLPPELADQWAQKARKSCFRSLRHQGELVKIGLLLARAGITAQVLKGGAIAWRGWFDPAIRPMRDLDLLCRPEHAIAVHQLLRDEGYVGPAAVSLGDGKHLPGLTAPNGGVLIEVHSRLIDVSTAQWAARDAYFCESSWGRVLPMAGGKAGLCIPSDADVLLHVIIHGALDHQFNNGPLLLFDVLEILANGAIDWSVFWEAAEQTGAKSAAQLALRLAEVVRPDLPIDWHGNAPQQLGAETIVSAASLMLVDMDRRSELGILGRIARLRRGERLSQVARALQRAGAAPAAPGEKSGSIFSRLSGRATAYAAVLGDRDDRNHLRRSLDVARWLREDPSS